MRLIDADLLKRTVSKPVFDRFQEAFLNRLVDKAPTVEAIPIDWLEQWTQIRGTVSGIVISALIRRWREEQEERKEE